MTSIEVHRLIQGYFKEGWLHSLPNPTTRLSNGDITLSPEYELINKNSETNKWIKKKPTF